MIFLGSKSSTSDHSATAMVPVSWWNTSRSNWISANTSLVIFTRNGDDFFKYRIRKTFKNLASSEFDNHEKKTTDR